jgi:hypothetical protein
MGGVVDIWKTQATTNLGAEVSRLKQHAYVEQLILAGGSLLRSGQTHVGKPKIGERAQ